MKRSILSKLFVAILCSIMLVSCSGKSSSNRVTKSTSTTTTTTFKNIGRSIGDGVNIINDGVEISVDANGVPTIVNDPTNQAMITQTTNGGLTINTSENSNVSISPNRNSVNIENKNGTIFIDGVEQ